MVCVLLSAIIVSPWTAGGWVSSQPFDHTSVLQFLERVTGVKEPNISAWRRRPSTCATIRRCGSSDPRECVTRDGGGRADARLAIGGDGEIYIVSKPDGMIRKLTAVVMPPPAR